MGDTSPGAWRVKVALALLVLAMAILAIVGKLATDGREIPGVLSAALTGIVAGVVGLLAYHAGSNTPGASGGTPA